MSTIRFTLLSGTQALRIATTIKLNSSLPSLLTSPSKIAATGRLKLAPQSSNKKKLPLSAPPITPPSPTTALTAFQEERIQVKKDLLTGLLVTPSKLSAQQQNKVEWVQAMFEAKQSHANPIINNDELISGGLQSSITKQNDDISTYPERKASVSTIEVVTAGTPVTPQITEVKTFVEQYLPQLAGYQRIVIIPNAAGMPIGSGNAIAVNISIGNDPTKRALFINADRMTLYRDAAFEIIVNEESDLELFLKVGEADVQTLQSSSATIVRAAVNAKDLETVERRLEKAIEYKLDREISIARQYTDQNPVFKPGPIANPTGALEAQKEAFRKFDIDIPLDSDTNGLHFLSPEFTQTPGADIFSVPFSSIPKGKPFTTGKGADRFVIYGINGKLTVNSNNARDKFGISVESGGEVDVFTGKDPDIVTAWVNEGGILRLNPDVEEARIIFNRGTILASPSTSLIFANPSLRGNIGSL